MEAVLFNIEKKGDINFLLELAKKLGISAKALTKTEIEDWKLAQRIETGMKTSNTSRAEIMKALGK